MQAVADHYLELDELPDAISPRQLCFPSLNDLPPELLSTIFSWLKPKEVCKLALVCRRWAQVVSDDHEVWRQMAERRMTVQATKEARKTVPRTGTLSSSQHPSLYSSNVEEEDDDDDEEEETGSSTGQTTSSRRQRRNKLPVPTWKQLVFLHYKDKRQMNQQLRSGLTDIRTRYIKRIWELSMDDLLRRLLYAVMWDYDAYLERLIRKYPKLIVLIDEQRAILLCIAILNARRKCLPIVDRFYRTRPHCVAHVNTTDDGVSSPQPISQCQCLFQCKENMQDALSILYVLIARHDIATLKILDRLHSQCCQVKQDGEPNVLLVKIREKTHEVADQALARIVGERWVML